MTRRQVAVAGSAEPSKGRRNLFRLNRSDGRYSSGGDMRALAVAPVLWRHHLRRPNLSYRSADASAMTPARDGTDHRTGARANVSRAAAPAVAPIDRQALFEEPSPLQRRIAQTRSRQPGVAAEPTRR